MATESDTLEFESKDWKILPRLSRTIPFGYSVHESDPDLLVPIPLELEALELAKSYIKRGFSLRETSAWLESTTGRRISAQGLGKRVKIANKRRRQKNLTEVYARKAKIAAEKVRKFEQRIDSK